MKGKSNHKTVQLMVESAFPDLGPYSSGLDLLFRGNDLSSMLAEKPNRRNGNYPTGEWGRLEPSTAMLGLGSILTRMTHRYELCVRATNIVTACHVIMHHGDMVDKGGLLEWELLKFVNFMTDKVLSWSALRGHVRNDITSIIECYFDRDYQSLVKRSAVKLIDKTFACQNKPNLVPHQLSSAFIDNSLAVEQSYNDIFGRLNSDDCSELVAALSARTEKGLRPDEFVGRSLTHHHMNLILFIAFPSEPASTSEALNNDVEHAELLKSDEVSDG